MKREIKFRAWDRDMREMVFVSGIQLDPHSPLEKPNIIDERNDIRDLDEIELMQFTGLKDKNGKEIYEGDIVSIENDKNPVITKCIWETGQYHLEDSADGHWTRQLYHQPEKLLIIGNIYENPELM